MKTNGEIVWHKTNFSKQITQKILLDKIFAFVTKNLEREREQ